MVGAPANFTVETFSAGKGTVHSHCSHIDNCNNTKMLSSTGTVDVSILNPNGSSETADVRFNNDKNLTYSVSYIPKYEGPHKVFVKFSGRDIPKSPYEVKVEGHAGDATKVTVSGPGLQPDGISVGRSTFFDINTSEAGRGTPEVYIRSVL